MHLSPWLWRAIAGTNAGPLSKFYCFEEWDFDADVVMVDNE